MAVIFTLDYTGTASADDVLAARHIIALENARLALQNPPGTPLPTATGPQLKASYLSVLLGIVTNAHVSYVALARSPEGIAARMTPAELESIRVNLLTRINAGETPAQLATDTVA